MPRPDELHGLDPGELLARALDTVRPSTGSAAWLPPDAGELGAMLPQYRIERLIGRGGMGAVYRGVHHSLDRAVAIKLLPAEMAGDRQFVARFQREAQTLARLQHPGIVTVYDCGQTTEGHLFFAMEFVDGTDLQHYLRTQSLQPPQAFELIMQICDALHYAHRHGVIHRDIKPANILIDLEGRARLADFGLARPSTGENLDLTSTNMVMGTPDYMAPEQRAGHSDHRSDIFALGVMLYEMLTGQRPHGAFDPPSQKVSVDVRIDAVVLKALQAEPGRRYQQVSEMRTDVDHIRTTPPAGIPAAVKRRPAMLRSSARVGFAMALVVLLAAAWGLRRKETPVLNATPRDSITTSAPPPAADSTQRPVPTPAAVASASPPTSAPAIATTATPSPSTTAMPVLPMPTPRPDSPAPAALVAIYSSLPQALISTAWVWTSPPKDDRLLTERRFTSQGTTTAYRGGVVASTGRWEIAGARMVKIQDAQTGRVTFQSFDPAFTVFDEVDAQGQPRARGTRKERSPSALAPGR